MKRRSLLGTTALALGSSLAGCSQIGARPDVRMSSGYGTLHPADERHIAHGLQSDGDSRVFTEVTPDEAPEWIGPDAGTSIVDRFRDPDVDEPFHLAVQLRSTPDAPMSIHPIPGRRAFEWHDRSTLRARFDVQPWGSFDRIDDEERREELRSAEGLVYTSVWDLTPASDNIPADVIVELDSHG